MDENDKPANPDDVITADNTFLTHGLTDSTWIYDINDCTDSCTSSSTITLPTTGANSILISAGSGDISWEPVDTHHNNIKELIKEHRVRGHTKSGKHTPKRCYE